MNAHTLHSVSAGVAPVCRQTHNALAVQYPGAPSWDRVKDDDQRRVVSVVARQLSSRLKARDPEYLALVPDSEDYFLTVGALALDPVSAELFRPPFVADARALRDELTFKHAAHPAAVWPDPVDVGHDACNWFMKERSGRATDLNPFSSADAGALRTRFTSFAFDGRAFLPVAEIAASFVVGAGSALRDQPERADVTNRVLWDFCRSEERRNPGGRYAHLVPSTDRDPERNEALRVLYSFARLNERSLRTKGHKLHVRRTDVKNLEERAGSDPDPNEPVGDWDPRLSGVVRSLSADERELLALIETGNTNEQLADALFGRATKKAVSRAAQRRFRLLARLRDLLNVSPPEPARPAPVAPNPPAEPAPDSRAELLADTERAKPDYLPVVRNLIRDCYTEDQIRLSLGIPRAANRRPQPPAETEGDAPHISGPAPSAD